MVVLLVELFIFINTSILFPDNTEFWSKTILSYILLSAAFFAMPDFKSPLFKLNFFQTLPRYLAVFLGTMFFMNMFKVIFVNASFSELLSGLSPMVVSVVILHSAVISIIEESVFRGQLQEKFGLFFSSATFAGFHFAVYGYNPNYLILMFLLGLVFGYIKKMWSPDGVYNSAVHGAYNVIALGVMGG